MDPLTAITAIAIALGAGIPSGLLWFLIHESRERARVLVETALACGLQDLEPIHSLGFPSGLRGRSGPLHATIRRLSSGPETLMVEVVNRGPWRTDLGLRPESAATRRAPELEIGHLDFDSAFCVTGTSALVRAVLDADTRRLLLTFPESLEIVNGELRAVLLAGHPPTLKVVIEMMLEAAQRLSRPRDVAGRLRENAQQEPESAVRYENLLCLIREYPNDPATRAALRAACSDTSDMIRLRAAVALGEEGRAVLLELVARDDVEDGLLAQAIEALGTQLPVERTKVILDRALRHRQIEVARACLFAVARSGGTEAVGFLAKVMRVEKGELASAAAHALAETGLAGAEGPLAQALEAQLPALRVAAAAALGRVGSVSVIPALKDAEDRYSGDANLRRATRQAIAAIQGRATGASPGQLSLAAGEAGQLSLAAEDERGRLSLDDEGPRR